MLCSYLQFLTLKLPPLLAVFWASHQSLASCRECVCTQLFPEAPRVRVSSIRCPCWTPCRRENVASFSKESWLYVLKSFPFFEGQSPQIQEKQKAFSPMIKKNKHGRITIFFPSDYPVGIKIPSSGYKRQAFKMHKDRFELLLWLWPSAPQTFMIP